MIPNLKIYVTLVLVRFYETLITCKFKFQASRPVSHENNAHIAVNLSL